MHHFNHHRYLVLLVLLGTIGALLLLQKDVKSKPHISAVIVPHHDLVATIRNSLFRKLAEKQLQPRTIILVSPNHYESGSATIQTSDQIWKTQFGDIQPNNQLITALIDSQKVTLMPGSFRNEHGIKSILIDIRTTFPGSSIVPLILSMNTTESEVTSLADFLNENCENCLLIASVDFSHYQPAPLADLHDALSIRGLETINRSVLSTIAETDSPPTLSLTAAWAERHNTHRFTLWKHTNSSTLAGDPTIQGTSHIFGWYGIGTRVSPDSRALFTVGSVSTELEPLHRSLWGTDTRILWGAKPAPATRPGEITLSDKGLLTWKGDLVNSVEIAAPQPVFVVFDTGYTLRKPDRANVVVAVQNYERAVYMAKQGVDLIVSTQDLHTDRIGSVPVVSGESTESKGILYSGSITSGGATITSRLVL